MMSHTDTFSEPHIVMHNRAFHMTLRSHIGVPKQGNCGNVSVPNQRNGSPCGWQKNETVAMLVLQKNETAAMLMFQTSPLGVELFSYVNAFFCCNKFA